MSRIRHFLLIVLFFLGCENKLSFEAKDVHWDRDMCERCKMVLSDHKFSAQIVDPKSARHYLFDDIGCAILWLNEEKIAWAEDAIIWVNDAKSGEWIDAKKAIYSTDNVTPMAYGFGAHLHEDLVFGAQETVDFATMRIKILKIGR